MNSGQMVHTGGETEEDGTGFLRTVAWEDGSVVLIDQTKLPTRLEYVKFDDYKQVASAIKNMIVRGAI